MFLEYGHGHWEVLFGNPFDESLVGVLWKAVMGDCELQRVASLLYNVFGHDEYF